MDKPSLMTSTISLSAHLALSRRSSYKSFSFIFPVNQIVIFSSSEPVVNSDPPPPPPPPIAV